MANSSASEYRRNLSINPPHQISKDVQGPDTNIPLSPQWLLPKPGQSRLGMGASESHSSSQPVHVNHSGVMKGAGNGEGMQDNQKKRDVFRPSLLHMETGRRDRWHDEEQDIHPPMRKDRWRDGDKELSDTRRMDRWADNVRHTGEVRRTPPERWSDSRNRDSNYDHRRESRWNTRWGSDDKGTNNTRDKLIDSGKDGDMSIDKGLSHLPIHGKDEKEGEPYQSWRSNPSQSRWKGEPTNHQTPNKQVTTFSYGRGRGENTLSTFSYGRGGGIGNSNPIGSIFPHHQTHGNEFDSGENGHGEGSPLRYNRTKLLDLYQKIDMREYKDLIDGIITVASLTQDDPLGPLALCAPNPDETFVLKGIEKGDVTSSGALQISKDGSVGRNSIDFSQSRRPKIGGREDLPHADDYNDESANGLKGVEDVGLYRKVEDVPVSGESILPGSNYVTPGTVWPGSSLGEQSHMVPHEQKDVVTNIGPRSPDISWSEPHKKAINLQESNVPNLLNLEDETRWKNNDNPVIKRQLSGILDRETEARKLSQPAPEDLLLYYKDPQGEIQGPFSGVDIIGWFEAGYFGIDLEVRLASAPKETPFSSLGDVMPHLRARARPPPGFGVPKQGESVDASGKPASSSFGMAHSGINEIDLVRSELRMKQGSTTEAQNRFLESLMSGSMSGSAQGLHGYAGNSSGIPPSGVENASDIYLPSQRMALEKQRSIPNTFPYWHGRDATSMIPKSEIIPESPMQRAKILPPTLENSLQAQSQSADLMAILQGVADRSAAEVNNGVGGWSNFPVQGGQDTLQDKIELLNSQKIPPQPHIGIQHQRLLSQIPPLTNLVGQAIDTPTGILPQEKLISSGLVQDPQLLNLLQQQYLMQIQSQAPVQAQQLPLLDKLLFLKQQQQKQEEQQQFIRQQQLLSQVLSEHHSLQRFGEASYGLGAVGLPVRNASLDSSQLEQSQDVFQIGSKIPLPKTMEEVPASFINLPSQVAQDVSHDGSSVASSFHLPHQIFDNANQKDVWSDTVAGQIIDGKNLEPFLASSIGESLTSSESIKLSSQQPLLVQPPLSSDIGNFVQEQTSEYTPDTDTTCPIATSVKGADQKTSKPPKSSASLSSGTNKFETPMDEKDEKIQPVTVIEREDASDLASSTTEIKNVEVKEMKKPSEKKSRKQKSSKSQSSDQAKGVSQASLVSSKKSGTEGSVEGDINAVGKSVHGVSSQKAKDIRPEIPTGGTVNSQDSQSSSTATMSGNDAGTTEVTVESRLSGSIEMKEQHVQSMQRAWKPAPGFKAKSLLEIQQEEQMKSQINVAAVEIASFVNFTSLSAPWAGVVASAEPKALAESQRDEGVPHLKMGKTVVSENINSKKSQLHDILAEEVLAKSSEREKEASDGVTSLASTQVTATHVEPKDDDNFIEAKETKKSRKRSAKTKGAAVKGPVPISSDVSLGTSPVEKGKSSRVMQQEEVVPAIPAGPSFGDFVPWKGEPVNPSPAPAWLTDSKKSPKPTSLREILKEQEKNPSIQPQSQIPIRKSQPGEVTHNGGPSWSISAPSPSKVASPVQINSQASVQSKYKADDDLFWGPVDQAKQDTKQTNFPLLANAGSWGDKSTVQGNASLSRQKSTGSRPLERVLSSSPSSNYSSVKGRKDNMTKQSEAMDFRNWCESECARLIGSKDTSFLEFCLKQSRAEAEILLVENLGSFDPNHEFIEKFLNYKELLPADVLEIAFQSRNDRKVTGLGATEMKSDDNGAGEFDLFSVDGSSKGVGKKKGKKGKKVSPSVLGFNVVSNRIMMGEIQTAED